MNPNPTTTTNPIATAATNVNHSHQKQGPLTRQENTGEYCEWKEILDDLTDFLTN